MNLVKPKCIIMRGLPGSGKSRWAALYRSHVAPQSCHICSTDHYFEDDDGVYKFDVTKLAAYHNNCLTDFANIAGRTIFPHVIVDNTNVRVFEIAPYYRLAEAFGYDVEIVWVVADVAKCVARNVHGVPAGIIENMSKSFEAIPHFWNQRIVVSE